MLGRFGLNSFLFVFLALIAALSQGTGPVHLNILYTNDIHGGLTGGMPFWSNHPSSPGIGGGAWIASFAREARTKCADEGEFMVLLDAGDIWQGTPVGNWDSGAFVVEWMNAAGYDMMTPGNHDFDRGAEIALRNAALAHFPVLCANFVTSEGETPEGILPFLIHEYDGVRVAFIGLTTPDTGNLVDPRGLAGYRFTHEVEAVETAIGQVRARGSHVIVLISHLGQPPNPGDYLKRIGKAWERGDEYRRDSAMNNAELTTVVPGIDVVVSGHIHLGLRRPWVNPVTGSIVVQGYGNGTGIGWLRLSIDRESGTVTGYDCPMGDGFVTLYHSHFPPDPEILEQIESYRSVAEAGMNQVIGHSLSAFPRGDAEHPLGRLVTDAMRWRTGADIALINRGGLRASLPAGPLTQLSVFNALPFDEDLFVFEVSGAVLLSVLEAGMEGGRRDMQVSGFTCGRLQAMPDGSRIVNPAVDGRPVEPGERYTLVTTGYLAMGGVGYGMLLGLEARPTGHSLMEAVHEYIRTHSPLEPDFEDRITWIHEERRTNRKLW